MNLPTSALVLGLARQGSAAADALERRGVLVLRVDRKLGNDHDLSALSSVDVLVKSGGVPNDAPLVVAAMGRGIPVWSDVEVAARILPNPLVAVTGTKGKTTTSALLGEMIAAPVGGNIGRAICALDGEVPPDTWIVCEVSTFQLEHTHTFRPPVAVLVNLETDHLDRHPSVDAYHAAKLRVFRNQRPEDTAVVPRGFRDIPGEARRIEFSGDDALPAEPLLPGAHNRENAAAATAAARAVGANERAIVHALRTFRGVPHRLESVADNGGVLWVNDSAGTNVAATMRALAAYDRPILLIAGGRAKGESFAPLAQAAKGHVRRAFLIGEAADELAFALGEIPHDLSGDLRTAVRAASDAAESGDVVLLSPACASYDQFVDFEARGDEFRRLAHELSGA